MPNIVMLLMSMKMMQKILFSHTDLNVKFSLQLLEFINLKKVLIFWMDGILDQLIH